jgi:hypothetical protein
MRTTGKAEKSRAEKRSTFIRSQLTIFLPWIFLPCLVHEKRAKNLNRSKRREQSFRRQSLFPLLAPVQIRFVTAQDVKSLPRWRFGLLCLPATAATCEGEGKSRQCGFKYRTLTRRLK